VPDIILHGNRVVLESSGRTTHIQEPPGAEFPETLLATLREDALYANDLEPYELLIETGERPLPPQGTIGAWLVARRKTSTNPVVA
jgi:hypothetical protein